VTADSDKQSPNFPTTVVAYGEVLRFGPVTTDLETPHSALAIGAHPDDIEIWCGGTLAKWAGDGCDIQFLVLTDGSKGTWDPDQDLDMLIRTRQQEQREAAKRLGGSDVGFVGWPDGELRNGSEERWEVCRRIREAKPDVVLTHDPWRRYRLHPDHRNAGFLVTDALVAARDPHYFAEQRLAPHRPRDLLLFEADVPNHVEVVDEVCANKKIDALLAYKSQYVTTLGITASSAPQEARSQSASVETFRDRIWSQLRQHGEVAGLEFGESFHRLGV
jgi:LmbE family N-acetylglucosaminyl deacetylase